MIIHKKRKLNTHLQAGFVCRTNSSQNKKKVDNNFDELSEVGGGGGGGGGGGSSDDTLRPHKVNLHGKSRISLSSARASAGKDIGKLIVEYST